MLELIGVDGLTQWDVGRQVKVDKDVDMVHFSNRPYGYSKNVKVTDGVADVPDMFLTSCAPLRVWTYVGDFEKGYTKIEKIYEVKPKNRPEDYIYTPEEVKTWEKLQSEIGDLADLETKAKENLVAAINEAAKSGCKSYTLPQATSKALGGVKADPATADDTQPVRIDDSGKLVTAAGSGSDISLGLTSAAVGQTIKVKAIDESGKPTAWEAANMPSGGGHWETVLDTVWEQDVINPTAFDSGTGIFTCAEGELNNLELNKEYIFFQQCKKQGVAFNTILNNNIVKVTKLSDTTFSIDVTPPTTFVPTNVKFSKGACLAVTNIDAKKIRLTLDGQFKPTATLYDRSFYGMNAPYFGRNTGYTQIRNAYPAYQQVTAEVESPYRIVGEILCGFNAPSQNASFHFKNSSFCCPLVPTEFSEENMNLSSDGTKIAKLYSTSTPWHLGGGSENTAISNDYLKIISGTKVKLERWVE